MAKSILTPFTFTAGGNTISNEVVGTIPLNIRGAVSQSANLQQWQTWNGTTASTVALVTSGGSIFSGANGGFGTTSALSTARLSVSAAASSIGVIVRGNATTPGNLQEWQSSTPTTVASISALGKLTSVGLETSNGITITGANSPIVFGSNHGTSGQVLTSQGTANTPTWTTISGGSFTGGTLTSDLILAAGSGTVEPLTFQTNSATPTTTSGAMDYDGTVFYQTANTNPGRALATQDYYYASSANYVIDFTGSAAAQSVLGASTRGITVAAGTTYEYELSMAVRHQFQIETGITGTFSLVNTAGATMAHVSYVDYGSNTTDFTTATTMSSVRTTGNVTFSPTISTGSRYSIVKVKGLIRVTVSGTTKIYPALSTSAINQNIWTVQSGLIFNLTPIGNGTATSVGTWA